MPRGDWCSTTARCGGRAKVAPSSRSRTRIAHSPSAFSAGGDSSFGFGGGAFFFLGFFPMPICVGGDEARGRGRAGQRRAGKLKAARAVEGAPSEKKPHREGRGRDAPRGRRAGARRARRRTIASRHATTRDAGRRRGAGLGGGRTSCSMCPMSSSISDCLRSGWNASPLGPRARAMGAQDPSSFHRAIGRR